MHAEDRVEGAGGGMGYDRGRLLGMRRAFRGWLRLQGSPAVIKWARGCCEMARASAEPHKEIDGKETGEVGYAIWFGLASRVGGSLEDPRFENEEKHRVTKSAMGHIPVEVRMTL
jgi:hypothetical protein